MSSAESLNMRLLSQNTLDGFGNVGEGIAVQIANDGRRILWLAHTAKGGLDPLPPEAVQKLLDTRSALGVSTTNTLENRCGLE